MKIATKKQQVDLTEILPSTLSVSKFMHNVEVKQVLLLNEQEIGLVRSSSILIGHPQSTSIVRIINLDSEIEQVVYIPRINLFYAHEKAKRQLISITNEQNPTVKVLYKFDEHRVNAQFQWPPWIFFFEQSENIILVRKVYGGSHIVILRASPTFQKIWEFTCNESSIAKLDEIQYLVNFEEYNPKFRVIFELYNCTQQTRHLFRIENIDPNTCKGVKLYEKIIEKSNKSAKTWLKTLIGVNYKTKGSGILLVNLLEGSANHYEILALVPLENAQIYAILNTNLKSQTIQVLQYRYFKQERQTKIFFTNYAWSNFENALIVTDDKLVESSLEDFTFSSSLNRLTTFTNLYNKQIQSSYEKLSHKLSLSSYRLLSKKTAYLHLLQNSMSIFDANFLQSVCDLL